MIGLGWHDTNRPPVIARGVLENPGWYTAYTPYQPEISQGRLEMLLNFQTVVADLTGLPVAGASLLDESTAAAEAMALCRRSSKSTSPRFIVDKECHPHTLGVMLTRAEPIGIEIVTADLAEGLPDGEMFGVLVAFPGSTGRVMSLDAVVAGAHDRGALVAVTTDLLALTILRPPGEWGPTSRSARPSGSGSRSASAGRTPASWRCGPASSAACPGGWSASASTRPAHRPTGWPCRPASSTSGARRRPATSARHRCCSR